MLHLLLGEAGTGKTTALYERLEQAARRGGPVFLLVPEQFSFESERALCRRMGEKLALGVQVLSFTRLCHKIFYQYGQVAGAVAGPPAKAMLMSIALEQVRDALQVYGAQAGNAGFVPLLLDMVGELKNAGAAPADLLAAAGRTGDGPLSGKLRELAVVYQAYQALLEKSFCDPADSIPRALRLCEGRGFFKGAQVFLDAFAAFMAPELALIERMLAECDDLTVAACCDSLSDPQGTSVFAPVVATVHHLLAAAGRAGVPVAAPEWFTAQRRAGNEAMRFLYAHYLHGSERFAGHQNAVQVVPAGDLYDETEFMAREINALVYDHGLRYRDIAVITRSIAAYEDAIDDIFLKYHIPVGLDRREEVESFPLVNLILSALLAVKGGFDTGQLITLSKNPLLGIPEEDAFELENYCFIWDVRGRLWQAPFRANPDGLAQSLGDGARERLARVEAARQTLMAPLCALRDALRQPTGRAFAQAVYAYLEDTGALARLPQVCRVQESQSYVDVQSRLFDGVMDILDTFYEVLGPTPLNKTRLIELFRLAVQSCDVGKLPQTQDQVLAGSADRVRPTGVRVAFLCGAAEGEFPLHLGPGGLFSDRERALIRQGGVQINTAQVQLNQLERFYTYFAVTLPSQRLYISYPTRAVSGEEKRASMLVRAVCGLFEGCVRELPSFDPARGLVCRENAFALLCSLWNEPGPLREALYRLFADTGEVQRLETALRAVRDKNFTIAQKEVAEKLFGFTQALSPSRLERYYGCAFAYFCEGGLRLKKRRKVTFSPLESGSLIHHVLEYMVKKYCAGPQKDDKLPPLQELRAEVSALIEAYLAERTEDEATLGKRFKYMFTRLVNLLCRLVARLWEEFSCSDFAPYAFELPIGPEEKNRPVVLQTPGGARVYVQGIVDRVDILESAKGRYLRVVDYKSGSKAFNLSDVYYGLNMQMLLYLFTLAQNGEPGLRGAFPAGVLYMPAREGVLTVERETTPQEIAAERAKGLRMNGLLLDNISVLDHMEREVSGVFIPAKLKKDGTLERHSAVATLEEFGRLHRHINKLVCDMADSLLSGQVGALPASGLGYDPCAYCDYRGVCRRQEDSPARALCEMSREELLQRLEQEQREELKVLEGKEARHG